MRDMAMACAWWPIMLYMNSTSASTYGLRRLSARALATYALSLPAALVAGVAAVVLPLTLAVTLGAGCGAVWLADGAAGPLQPASAAARIDAARVQWLLVIRSILMSEVLLRDHHVHPEVAVHELGDV